MTDDAASKLPRLFIPFDDADNIVVSEGQQHYLRNVMRCEKGDRLRVFNGRDGEWVAEIKDISKKNVLISLLEKTREQTPSRDTWVLASPVKKEAFDFMVEKASELGAARFVPVACERTVVHRVNTARAGGIAIEAAEQCERLDVMAVEDIAPLKDILKSWNKNRKLIFCIERKDAPSIVEALGKLPAGPLAILVGPEGGFSENEIAFISGLDYAVPVSLGPRVLRAETAVVAALAGLVAVRGS